MGTVRVRDLPLVVDFLNVITQEARSSVVKAKASEMRQAQ